MKISILPIKTQDNDADGKSVGILLEQIRKLIQTARRTAVTTINSLQVITYFQIGRMIVEHEQQGLARAEYGKQILKTLGERLTEEFGRGFSRSNLQNMRNFFLLYQDRLSQIGQMPSDKLKTRANKKSQMPSGKLNVSGFSLEVDVLKMTLPFRLSWSQYVFLIGINDARERSFYEIEAVENSWTLPELRRQFDSGLYERLALSRDKEGVQKLARKGQVVTKPQDVIKEPYVLEFLGLDEKASFSESDLETAIIDKLEQFLLELGKGFLFEARQKRFTFGEEHFFVDLVFYNRLLRCYVLIDLKIGKLTHQDLGQMQMYVNYFDRHVKLDNENQTVGIILCKKKHEAMVEITLPKKANIYASQYQLYLPSKEDLKQRLMEWAEELQ